MKIRQGFVSNSSSSSYVVLIKDEEHKRVLEEHFPEGNERRAVEYIASEEGDVFGIPVRVLRMWYDMGGNDQFSWNDFQEPEEYTEADKKVVTDYTGCGEDHINSSTYLHAVSEKYQSLLAGNSIVSFTAQEE